MPPSSVTRVIFITPYLDTRLLAPSPAGRFRPAGKTARPGIAGVPGPEALRMAQPASHIAKGKFDRFLPFGLTLSPSRPTVTERNHPTDQTNWPGGRRTCHLSTQRPWARGCALSAHSRA